MVHSLEDERKISIAIIAIVTALGVLGVVIVLAVMTIPLQQQAEAIGCPAGTPGANASKGRCFRG